MRSAELIEFGSSLRGKKRKLLLVGDAFSAEDLTLQVLKAGADYVYFTSSGGGSCIHHVQLTWESSRKLVVSP